MQTLLPLFVLFFFINTFSLILVWVFSFFCLCRNNVVCTICRFLEYHRYESLDPSGNSKSTRYAGACQSFTWTPSALPMELWYLQLSYTMATCKQYDSWVCRHGISQGIILRVAKNTRSKGTDNFLSLYFLVNAPIKCCTIHFHGYFRTFSPLLQIRPPFGFSALTGYNY